MKEHSYSPGNTSDEVKEKDETLWIDRRWNISDSSQDGSCSSDKKLLKHLDNHSDNEYAYIDRAKLATFASEYSMNTGAHEYNGGHVGQFHDLAPYASTDILRNQIPSLYQVRTNSILFQGNRFAKCINDTATAPEVFGQIVFQISKTLLGYFAHWLKKPDMGQKVKPKI